MVQDVCIAPVGSITVERGGKTVASTTPAWRVLETSHPPAVYLPHDAFFAEGVLRDIGVVVV